MYWQTVALQEIRQLMSDFSPDMPPSALDNKLRLFFMICSCLSKFTLEPTAQNQLLNMYTEIGRLSHICDPYMEEFLTGVSKVVEQLNAIEETQLGILADLVNRLGESNSVEHFGQWTNEEMHNQEIVARATGKLIECCTKHLIAINKPKSQTSGKSSNNSISASDLESIIIGVDDHKKFSQMGQEDSEDDDEDIKHSKDVQRVTGSKKHFTPAFEESYSQFLMKMFRKSVQLVNTAVQIHGQKLFDELIYTSTLNHCCTAFMVLLQATIGCMSFFESLSSDLLCNSDTLYQFIKGLAEPHALHLDKLMDDPLGLLQDVISMSKSERVYTSCLQTQAGRLISSDNMVLMGLNSCFITWAIRDIEAKMQQPDSVARIGGPMIIIGHCGSRLTDSEPRIIRVLINCIQYVTYFVQRVPSNHDEKVSLENICYLLHFIRLHIRQVFKWTEKTKKTVKTHAAADSSDETHTPRQAVVQTLAAIVESQQRVQVADKIPEFLKLKNDLERSIVGFLQLTGSPEFNSPPVSVWFADTIDSIVKAAKEEKNSKEFLGHLVLPILSKVLNQDRGARDRSDWDLIGVLDLIVQDGGPKNEEVRVTILEILEKLFLEYFRARERGGYSSGGRNPYGRRNYGDDDEYGYRDAYSYLMHGGSRDHSRMDSTELHNLLTNLVPICTNEKTKHQTRHPRDTGLQGSFGAAATQILNRLLELFTTRADQHQLVVLGEFIFPLVRLHLDLADGVTEASITFLEQLVDKEGSSRSIEEKEFELIVTVFGANPSPQLPEMRLELVNTRLRTLQTKIAEKCIANIKPCDQFKSTRVVFSMLSLQRLILNHGHTMPAGVLGQVVQNVRLLMSSESILKGTHTAGLSLVCTVKLAVAWCPYPEEAHRAVEQETSGLLNVLVSRLADSPLSYLSSTRAIKLLGLVALLDSRLELALHLAYLYFLSEGFSGNEANQAIALAAAYKDLQKYLKGTTILEMQEAEDRPREIYDEDEDEEVDIADYRNVDFAHPKQRRSLRRQEPDSNQMTHMVCCAGRLLDWTDNRELDLFQSLRDYLSTALKSADAVEAARKVLEGFPGSSKLLRVHRLQRDMYKTDFVQAYRIKRLSQTVRVSQH